MERHYRLIPQLTRKTTVALGSSHLEVVFAYQYAGITGTCGTDIPASAELHFPID